MVITIWPFIGIYRQYVFTNPFPYPLTLAFLVHLVTFTLGLFYFGVQIAKHGFTCGPHHRKVKKPKFDENGKQIKRKGPETPVSLCYRFVHWAFFPAMFSSIFIYAAYASIIPCYDNPNLCTLLFRADLWISALFFLSIAKAKRKGGRIDWIVGFILLIGIVTLQWNQKQNVALSLSQDMPIIIGGVLTFISFGMFCIMLRKATLGAGIFKILWVESFWGIWMMMPLSIYFDRNRGWHTAYDDPTKNPDWEIIWHMIVLIFALIFWHWAIVMSIAYSDTLIVALALTISLFLGDFGVYGYILDGFQFSAANIVGIILCSIGVLWLLKRLIMVSCPHLFGGALGKFFGEEPGREDDPEEEMDLLGPGFLDDDGYQESYAAPLPKTKSKTKYKSSSSLKTTHGSTYGATEARNPLYSPVEEKSGGLRDDSYSGGGDQESYSSDHDSSSSRDKRRSDKHSSKSSKRNSSSGRDKGYTKLKSSSRKYGNA